MLDLIPSCIFFLTYFLSFCLFLFYFQGNFLKMILEVFG